MAKTILTATGTAVAYPGGATRFSPCAISNISSYGAEASTQVTYRSAGTFSNLWVRVTANTITGGASTVTLRVDGADGNNTVSIGASATGTFEDTTHTDTITSGQKVNYEITTSSGTALTVNILSVIFSASTDTVSKLASIIAGGAAFATASVSRYNQLTGEISSAVTAETSAQTFFRTAGTLKNLEVYVSANARTTTTTVRTRKGAADGAQSVSIGSTATGWFEDTTNSDTIAQGNNADFVVVTGTGTQTLTIERIAVDFITTSGIGYSSYGRVGAFAQGEPVTNFPLIGGNAIVAATGTEANCQIKTRVPFTFSQMTVNITANSVNATSTLRFRKNGADGNQAISITTTQTGVLTDTTNTDVCDADDLVNLQLVTPAVSGTQTMTIRHFALQYTSTSTVTQTNIQKYHILQNITQTSIQKYHILTNVLQTSIQKYHILTSVIQSSIQKYNLFAYALVTSIHKYGILAYITQGSIHKYHILNTVLQNSIQKYHLLGAVLQTNIHKYHLVGSAIADSIHKYNIIGNTIATSIHKYHISQYVAQSAVHKYHIFQSVLQQSIHKYHILAFVIASSISKYHLRGAALQTHLHKYHISQYVTAESIHLYDIIAIGEVIASYIHKYDIRQNVAAASIQKYSILQSSGIQTSINKYNILANVLQNSIEKYHIGANVVQSSIHKYHILNTVVQTNIQKYHLRAAAIQTSIHKWHMAAYTLATSIHKYNIGQLAKRLVSMLGPGAGIELSNAAKIVIDRIKQGWPI